MPHPLLRTGRLLALCCCAALVNTAAVAGEALDVRIGYLGYRPDPGPLLSNVIPEPDDAGLRGAELAITDSNTTGRFLNHNYQLTARNSDSPEHLLDDARALRNDGLRLFIVNAPDDSLRQLAEALPDSLLINAKPCCEIYFPSAFTPNNDGRNDLFRPITVGTHQITAFRVQNRWGQVVFSTGDEL